MRQITQNDLLWLAIKTGMTADFSHLPTKEEREKAEQELTAKEFQRLKEEDGFVKKNG